MLSGMIGEMETVKGRRQLMDEGATSPLHLKNIAGVSLYVGRHHVLCDVIVGDVALWMHYGMERKDGGGRERGWILWNHS
jgi:hypothetical protein